ncbi:MAG: hypothetical protein V4543_04005 [Bacteroidota bacterium]
MPQTVNKAPEVFYTSVKPGTVPAFLSHTQNAAGSLIRAYSGASAFIKSCLSNKFPAALAGLFFAFFMIPGLLSAQNVPLGTWRMHLPYDNIMHVEAVGNMVYAASTEGFFRFSKTNNTIEILSKINGFSETRISDLRYDKETGVLGIAYETGNFDLLKNGTDIVNINTLKNLDVTKRNINNIFMSKGRAYLACEIGLIVINVDKEEVYASNTGLGASNAQLAVRSCAVFRDSLFLATDAGLKSLPVNLTFENTLLYKTYNAASDGLPVRAYNFVGAVNNSLVAWAMHQDAGTQPSINVNAGLWVRKGKRWTPLTFSNFNPGLGVRSVNASGDTLLVCTNDSIVKITLGANPVATVFKDTAFLAPNQATYDAENRIWIADGINGLVGRLDTGLGFVHPPQGPTVASPFRLYTYNNRLVALPGGIRNDFYNGVGLQKGIGFYENGKWTEMKPYATPGLPPGLTDFVDAGYIKSKKALYVSTYNFGLVIIPDNPADTVRFLPQDSLGLVPIANGFPSLRITSIREDFSSNIWFNVLLSRYPVGTQNAAGKWSNYLWTEDNPQKQYPYDMLIAGNNDKWIVCAPAKGQESQGTLMVLRDITTNKMLTESKLSGNLPSVVVNDIALDADQSIWAATNKGFCVFYSPSSAFSAEGISASTPIFDGRPVLENEIVKCIAIDGGGRKWVGTAASGVFLFNKDITKLEAHFNTENSPLPSNLITDIAIIPESGEVFFNTDNGMISYRSSGTGDAFNQATECGDAHVFPNPVRPGYSGDVAITGITGNANVKITDAAGRLAYEGTATGTTFTWNLHDYAGHAARTGMYFAFITAADGTGTCVQKFSVIK